MATEGVRPRADHHEQTERQLHRLLLLPLVLLAAHDIRLTWNNPLDNVDALPSDATLVTPLSRKAFRIEDVQEHRVLIQYRDDDETIPLQQAQFETLYERVSEALANSTLTACRQMPNRTLRSCLSIHASR
jgi:hypothetical protein